VLLPPFMCGDAWRSVPDLGMAVVGLNPGNGQHRTRRCGALRVFRSDQPSIRTSNRPSVSISSGHVFRP